MASADCEAINLRPIVPVAPDHCSIHIFAYYRYEASSHLTHSALPRVRSAAMPPASAALVG